jgi:flavin prenyltransferase
LTKVRPIVFAITGASGAPYAVNLLRALVDAKRAVQLIVSEHGWRLLDTECGVGNLKALESKTGTWTGLVNIFDDRDRGASPASGSALTACMVVCPCSMGTLAAISAGTSRSLIERAADVTLKERRPLVLVPRETPLSAIHLENMLRLTHAGAVVMPAAPGFYHRPTKIDDLVQFMVGRVLDHLGVENTVSGRWNPDATT